MSKSLKYVKEFDFGMKCGGSVKKKHEPLIPMKDGGQTNFGPKGRAKVGKVMNEFSSGELHSGGKKGPAVTSKKQAVAIALSEARKASKK